jgi:hypothetical protein
MQRAIQDDQKVYDKDGNESYIDNPEVEKPEVTDPFAQTESEDTNEANQ